MTKYHAVIHCNTVIDTKFVIHNSLQNGTHTFPYKSCLYAKATITVGNVGLRGGSCYNNYAKHNISMTSHCNMITTLLRNNNWHTLDLCCSQLYLCIDHYIPLYPKHPFQLK